MALKMYPKEQLTMISEQGLIRECEVQCETARVSIEMRNTVNNTDQFSQYSDHAGGYIQTVHLFSKTPFRLEKVSTLNYRVKDSLMIYLIDRHQGK